MVVKRIAMGFVVALAGVAAASGQTPPQGTAGQTAQQPATTSSMQQPAQPPASNEGAERRPATTTFMGDTGLWMVPTGEVLPAGMWSISAYRVNFDDNQGFSDISNWPVTFGFGVADRAEIFGAWTLVNRIDRDIRPLYVPSIPEAGGIVPQHPLARDGWTGNNLGDLWLGAKVALTAPWRQQPAAFALRGMLKLPTGDEDSGASTGKLDGVIDAIVSTEVNERVEISGFGGFIFRGEPDEVEQTNGFRWGIGAGFPTRKSLRFTAELYGEQYTKDSLATKTALVASDGSVLPVGFVSEVKSPVDVNLGLTWQGSNGLFAGAAWTWRLNMDSRDDFLSEYTNGTNDKMDLVFRLGYHPGVRIYVPPPPPPPPAPAPAPQNRPPTVVARCEPCTVEVGKTATVTADASDPDGDALTYKWSAPAGTLTSPTDRQSPWTAPLVEGPVQVTVTVTDTKGASANGNVTIQVIKPAVKEFVFEDVHFDFDRYSLRPEATRALDEAIRTLQENADLRIEVEGHTCNIGTAEYNLALGERRANAVRDYLTGRGIGADRLRTVSYGEERPKHDNAREETRRLNRRAAMVVRVQR